MEGLDLAGAKWQSGREKVEAGVKVDCGKWGMRLHSEHENENENGNGHSHGHV